MQKKYKNKGVILLAVSYEPERTVKTYIDKYKVSYVVGAGAEDAMEKYGVKGFPTAFLVDPDGKIAWTGHPQDNVERAIDKVLEEKPPKGKSFLITGSAKSLFKQAEGYFKKKKYEEALDLYEQLAGEYGSTKEGKDSKKRIKTMRGNSSIMGKIKMARAERQAEKWLRAARALARYGDAADAVKYYQRIIDEFPETKSAKYAQSEIEPFKKDAKESKATKKKKKSSESDDEDAESDEDSEGDDAESDEEDSGDEESGDEDE